MGWRFAVSGWRFAVGGLQLTVSFSSSSSVLGCRAWLVISGEQPAMRGNTEETYGTNGTYEAVNCQPQTANR